MYDANTEVDPFGLNPLVGLDLGNMRRDQIGEILSGVEIFHGKEDLLMDNLCNGNILIQEIQL